jgi:hypothetical protein
VLALVILYPFRRAGDIIRSGVISAIAYPRSPMTEGFIVRWGVSYLKHLAGVQVPAHDRKIDRAPVTTSKFTEPRTSVLSKPSPAVEESRLGCRWRQGPVCNH